MKVAVLMTCHNRQKKTIQCLDSLVEACGLCPFDEFDIWLLDDGSVDNTVTAVQNLFPMVRIVEGDGKLFWAKGMRKIWSEAVKYQKYDFYLWLNDDVVLKKESIKSAFRDYNLVGGVIVGACSDDETEDFCSYGATDEKDKKIIPNGKPQRGFGWLNGNFVLVSKDVFSKVGLISGEYSHARADYDYAERLKIAKVNFYSTSCFVGVCKNDFYKKVIHKVFFQRLKCLWTPSYWNISDLWRIRSRYYGIWRAILSCCHLIYIVVFFNNKRCR